MKRLLFLLWSGMTLSAARGEIPAGWGTNLVETLKVAMASNRPVLLYFTADWCGPCRQMQRTTLNDSTVATLLREFVPVALDLDAQATLATERHVSAIPCFLALAPSGDEVARTTGYLEADRFQEFLTTSLVAADLARDRQEEFRRIQAEVQKALAAGTPQASHQAVELLLKLCADRELLRQRFAEEQLRGLAGKEPIQLLPGLEHPQLIVRIASAKALREKLGETFDFDPWAPVRERQATIATWRQKLTQ